MRLSRCSSAFVMSLSGVFASADLSFTSWSLTSAANSQVDNDSGSSLPLPISLEQFAQSWPPPYDQDWSHSVYDFSQNGAVIRLRFNMEHHRHGTWFNYAYTDANLVFESNVETRYSFSGTYAGAGEGEFQLSAVLWAGGWGGPCVFCNFQDSRFLPDDPGAASFTIGQPNQSGNSSLEGFSVGSVPPGRYYLLIYTRIGNPGNFGDAGNGAAGSIVVTLTDTGVATIPGDVNGDCSVDLADLSILLSRFGSPDDLSHFDGDLDEDGDVDLSDLALLLANFGSTCP